MSEDPETNYFGWLATGHFQLVIGLLSTLLFGTYFVVGVARGAVGAIICFGVLALGGISGMVRGVQQMRARKVG